MKIACFKLLLKKIMSLTPTTSLYFLSTTTISSFEGPGSATTTHAESRAAIAPPPDFRLQFWSPVQSLNSTSSTGSSVKLSQNINAKDGPQVHQLSSETFHHLLNQSIRDHQHHRPAPQITASVSNTDDNTDQKAQKTEMGNQNEQASSTSSPVLSNNNNNNNNPLNQSPLLFGPHHHRHLALAHMAEFNAQMSKVGSSNHQLMPPPPSAIGDVPGPGAAASQEAAGEDGQGDKIYSRLHYNPLFPSLLSSPIFRKEFLRYRHILLVMKIHQIN